MLLQRFLIWYFCDRELVNPLKAFGALGVFGPITRKAVRDFQGYDPTVGLETDGVVGPFTLDAMDRVLMGLSAVGMPVPIDAGGAGEPSALKWRISGTSAVAEADGASLLALAKQVGGSLESIGCIRPVSMHRETHDTPSDFEMNYAAYVRAGDSFDVAALLQAERPAVQNEVYFHFFTGADEVRDAALARLLWPSLTPVSGNPDDDIHQAFIANGDPITKLVLYGHSGSGMMFGGTRTSHSILDPSVLSRDSPHGGGERTFTGMRSGEFARSCWFAKSGGTEVLAIGCNSSDFGRQFARAYLRRGAKVGTTTRFIVPTCLLNVNITPTQGCTNFDSLGLSSTVRADAALLAAMAQVRSGGAPTAGIGPWDALSSQARDNLTLNLTTISAYL